MPDRFKCFKCKRKLIAERFLPQEYNFTLSGGDISTVVVLPKHDAVDICGDCRLELLLSLKEKQ
jgi:hypothetical protein